MDQYQAMPEFTDEGLNILQQPSQTSLKLPRIQPPVSRGNVKSKNDKRVTPGLPIINLHATSISQQQRAKTQKKKLPNEIGRDEFAMQIQQRLKLVLQNVGQQEYQNQEEDNQDIDFETLINQNKQILKLHQKKNQQNKINSSNLMDQNEKKVGKSKNKIMKQNYSGKADNFFEKRLKQYRDMSSENKYIQKKKEIVAQKSQAIQKAKSLAKNKQDNNKVPIPPKQPPKNNAHFNKERIKKYINEQPKSTNLFDNIHLFLQNPKKHIKFSNDLQRLSKANIKELEDRLKKINEQLGVNENQQTTSTEEGVVFDHKTVRDWKKIQITNSNKGSINCMESTFQQQIQRVNKLQQKNSLCLNHYLDHQKILVELELLKKLQAKVESNTS